MREEPLMEASRSELDSEKEVWTATRYMSSGLYSALVSPPYAYLVETKMDANYTSLLSYVRVPEIVLWKTYSMT
jgi:hypothetical protein